MNEFVKLFGAVVFHFIFLRGCNGECNVLQEEIKYELLKSGTSFFGNCCSLDKNATLRWLDSLKQEVPIGLGTDSNAYTEKYENEINLYIKKLNRGTYDYTCLSEIDGKSFTLQQIIIEVYDPPFIYNTDEYQNVIKGSDGVVSCSVGPINDTNIYTEWLREKYDEIQIVENEKYNVNAETGLKIKNVDDEDGGIYKCRASHYKSGDIVEQQIQVEVITLPTISDLKVTPLDKINEGDTLIIECLAKGQPHPEYTWKKISKTEENTTRWTQYINTITIKNVDRNDEGVYECTANNTGGSARSTVTIEVQYAPNITSFENVTVLEGSSSVMLECKATGRPTPDVEIVPDIDFEIYPSLPLISGNFTETEAKRTITFIDVSRFHDGLYYCIANNSVDSMTTVSKLTVLHKPYIIGNNMETVWGWNGKTVNLTCDHESNPPGAIIWNFKGNNSNNDGQLIVKVMKNITIDSNHATFTIDNEAYYGIYECSVVNKYGKDIKTIHVKRAFLPGIIVNATVFEVKPTSVTFDIIGPEESKVTGYTAQYDENRNFDVTNIHLNRTWSVDRPYKIDKLKPGTDYNVRFAAKNELGDGNWSDYLSFHTLRSTSPDAPTWNLDSKETAALREATELAAITLKWNEPENNGEPIDYYTIRYCAEENENFTDTVEDINCEEQMLLNNEITIQNLKSNTTYRIDVSAHNINGNSSAISTFITTSALISDQPTSLLSAGAIIAVSVITVFFCLLILDIILLLWQKKGIIASCFKKKKKKEDNFNSRDNKGLLKHSIETDDTLKRPANRTIQPEYKHTGVITGRHSAV